MPHLTRRQALLAGAAAAAAGALAPGRANGASRAGSFTLPVDAPTSGAVAAGAGWHTTRVVAAPRRFELIGLGWSAGRADAQVRARQAGGRWTRWTALPDAGDHGPDAGRGRRGTDAAWTGAADEFQLRVRGDARGLTARFVHASPAVPRLARLAARRQIPGAPAIIPRSAWGGDSVTPRAAPAYGQVQLAFVHHTVNANDYGPEDSAAMVLAIAKYHRDHLGWNDLGYNFIVDRYGQIFEGRAGGVDLAIVGAQAQGYNSVSTGVSCLGTYTDVLQTEAGLNAVAALIGWKLTLHGVPVTGQVTVTSAGGETNRFPSGRPVTFERISGHRDGNATECPGALLYGQLADLRLRAAGTVPAPVAGLTVRASTTRVRGVTPTTLSGTLRFADGASPAGARVELVYLTRSGGTGAVLATAVCAADGRWSATVALTATGSVRARYAGDATRPALESQQVDITVVPSLALALSATHLRRRRALRLSGTLAPAGPQVQLLWERKVRGRYRRVRTRAVGVRGGRYAATLRPARPGLYRVTISVPGASLRRYVRVR